MTVDSCQKVTLVASSLGGLAFLTVATHSSIVTYKPHLCSLAALSDSVLLYSSNLSVWVFLSALFSIFLLFNISLYFLCSFLILSLTFLSCLLLISCSPLSLLTCVFTSQKYKKHHKEEDETEK